MRGVLVAVALVGTCRAACDPCADGLCYTLYSGEDSPSEAEDRCEARGGHLAKVTTAGQVAAVKHVLEFVPDGNCVRFGAIKEAGSWRWTDGTAVTAIDVIENSGGEYCSCYWVEDENVYDAPCHGGWGQLLPLRDKRGRWLCRLRHLRWPRRQVRHGRRVRVQDCCRRERW